jgi:protein-serine/threonine kinase
LIVNSKVYRRVLASAKGKVLGNDQQVIEGDLIDLSESQTIIAEQVDGTTRDLECLIISHDEQTFKISPKSPISHAINDLDRLQTSAAQEGTERENIPPLDASPPRPKVNVPSLASSSFVDGESRHTSKALREKSDNPKKQGSFGEYVLGHTLYESERSKVKLAWKVEGGVQFTVKLRKRTHIPTSLAKTYREVAILRELYHPNIVRLREVVETETLIGIILGYASGGDLRDYINNRLYLKDNAAQKLFAQLISGVRYLHMKGIVHLDLTLRNVLLDRNRNIIISGFSYANTFNPEDKLGEQIEKNLGDPDFVKTMKLDVIQPGGFLRGDLMQERGGKPIYSAPELMLGDLPYTARKTDIWSCGVILVSVGLIF